MRRDPGTGKLVGTKRRYAHRFATPKGKFQCSTSDAGFGWPAEVARHLVGDAPKKWPYWLTTGRAQRPWQTGYHDQHQPERMAEVPLPYVDLHAEDAKVVGVVPGDLPDQRLHGSQDHDPLVQRHARGHPEVGGRHRGRARRGQRPAEQQLHVGAFDLAAKWPSTDAGEARSLDLAPPSLYYRMPGGPQRRNGVFMVLLIVCSLASAFTTAASRMGYTLLNVGGDFNGDGRGDVMQVSGTTVYLYPSEARGSSANIRDNAKASTTFPGSSTGAVSVAAVGDINGDGFEEVIVGDPDANSGAGSVFICYGARPYTGMNCSTHVDGTATDLHLSGLGVEVAAAGNFNGDRYADFAVSTASGTVLLYTGGATGPSLSMEVRPPHFVTGYALSGGSDVNGDGLDDVLVGDAPGNQVSVIYGNPGRRELRVTIPAPYVATSTDCVTVGSFGYSVAALGDVDGDGYAEVGVGAPMDERACTFGREYVLFGGLRPGAHFNVFQGNAADGSGTYEIGYTTGGIADYNADGIADLVLGGEAAVYYPGIAGGWAGRDTMTAVSGGQVVGNGWAPEPLCTVPDGNEDGADELFLIQLIGGGHKWGALLIGEPVP